MSDKILTEIYDEVREALTKLAADETYGKMMDPEYNKIISSLARDIAMATVKVDLDEDEDEDEEELTELVCAEIEKMFSSDEQLKELAKQSAANRYVTKNEAKAYLSGYLAALNPDIELEPVKLDQLKEAHKTFLSQCQKAYDLVDELLSNMVGIAEREGIEKAVTIERRNSIIKAIVPSAEKYIEIYSTSWKAAQEFFDAVQKAMFDEPETEEVGKVMFGAIKDSVSSISEDLLQREADSIYK